MKELHLICNAHLDPVWLWDWEDGASEALATFRAAADLCDESDVLIFNHNEALLYRWIEEFEPTLFVRIQRLVQAGRWHIMGGWYLQPDCNLPSGEAIVRQVLHGRRYFQEKFGAAPRTAINFDSFGHSRGLVQILTQAGFDSYIHTRPSTDEFAYPGEEYRWVGFDGSSVMAHQENGYNTRKGLAVEKIQTWLDSHDDGARGLLLWGIGNHGGGPSREDLRRIAELKAASPQCNIVHATPESFFDGLDGAALPEVSRSLNPCLVGCYTSQARIKQRYRALENDLFLAEKMAAHAALAGRMTYPGRELREVCEDMLFAQFHDILAGSSIQSAEDASLRLMEHGLEIAARVKARAFFALAAGEDKAEGASIPLFIYNPHPHTVPRTIDLEFTLEDVYLDEEYFEPVLVHEGREIPVQCEREASNLPIEFRKRVVFQLDLKPAQMNRVDCTLRRLESRPAPALNTSADTIEVRTPRSTVVIGRRSGLIEQYAVDGVDYLKPGAFVPAVLKDKDDAWGFWVKQFDPVGVPFTLMTADQVRAASSLASDLSDAVRIIEDGPVRMVVEALFQHGASIVVQRYLIPKQSTEFAIETRVYWNEQHKMLKLEVPTALISCELLAQTMYGIEPLPGNGDEGVIHRWTAVADRAAGRALTVINDGSYGADLNGGRLRLSLLRSPGYAAMSFRERDPMPQDRFSPRIDQGERLFRCWVNGGTIDERLNTIDAEALAHNEAPMALASFPPGVGEKCGTAVALDDPAVQLTALKQAEGEAGVYIIRLFESTGAARSATLRLPALGLKTPLHFAPFEIKTLRLDSGNNNLRLSSLLET